MAAAWGLIPLQLPPGLQPVVAWRYAIAGGVALLAFLFLLLQLMWGSGLSLGGVHKLEANKHGREGTAPETESHG